MSQGIVATDEHKEESPPLLKWLLAGAVALLVAALLAWYPTRADGNAGPTEVLSSGVTRPAGGSAPGSADNADGSANDNSTSSGPATGQAVPVDSVDPVTGQIVRSYAVASSAPGAPGSPGTPGTPGAAGVPGAAAPGQGAPVNPSTGPVDPAAPIYVPVPLPLPLPADPSPSPISPIAAPDEVIVPPALVEPAPAPEVPPAGEPVPEPRPSEVPVTEEASTEGLITDAP